MKENKGCAASTPWWPDALNFEPDTANQQAFHRGMLPSGAHQAPPPRKNPSS